jgi:hypothetical protein
MVRLGESRSDDLAVETAAGLSDISPSAGDVRNISGLAPSRLPSAHHHDEFVNTFRQSLRRKAPAPMA